jgi:dolichol-phosphate mannosyltransferase
LLQLLTEGVSVVTTTWNEADNIEKLVTAVRKVLAGVAHEIIVVDDSSTDGTIEITQRVADVAVSKQREGQSKGLLHGMQLAKYPFVVTIDADLENDPKYIPQMLQQMQTGADVVVASRTKIPRFSEKVASKTLGKLVGVTDFFSNFRAFRTEHVPMFVLGEGEMFGSEFLILAKKHKLKITEIRYEAPPRRQNPRIGGTLRANVRILWATAKAMWLYVK